MISIEIGKDKIRKIDTTPEITEIWIETKIEIDSIEIEIEIIKKTEIETNKKIEDYKRIDTEKNNGKNKNNCKSTKIKIISNTTGKRIE